MQTPTFTQKIKVTKSKSTSLLVKQKIGIALGKTQQKLPGQNMKTQQKCNENNNKTTRSTSYLSKQRSYSLKSLKENNNKKAQNLTQRQPSGTSQKHYSPMSITTSSKLLVKSNQFQNNDNLTTNITNPSNQLIWLDSKNRKLKIINKSILTVGDTTQESLVQFSIDDGQKAQTLLQIKNCRMSIVTQLQLECMKYDEKINGISMIMLKPTQQTVSLMFNGYVFLSYHHKDNLRKSEQIFNWLLQQIQTLNQDGLKDFSIVSKIVKRLLQIKCSSQKEQFFILLIKISNQSQIVSAVKKNVIRTTQELISQKLCCIQKTQQKEGRNVVKMIFSKKKFIEQ